MSVATAPDDTDSDPTDATDDTDHLAGRARIDAALAPVRRGRYAEPALLVAVLVGVAVSAVHWGGLILGGALVGLVSHSLRRAVVNGFSFGLFVLVCFAGWLAWQGALLTWPTTGQLFVLTVASALGLPILAAGAVRGLL
ncbi:hypothetical protein [Salinirubrum litoreum]|uniref:Uncharacterized protein n=1 Tax=Salinirubrum litoreum TaxID=1126234 RepID=A0ABD5RDV0_9EURY|nr:hypothetical protein [Salinirubrum litoreum]